MTIGQNLIEPAALRIVGANAALVGDAAHDTVANFLGGLLTFEGTNAAAYYLPLSDAINGTTIKVLQPGVYEVRGEASVVAGTSGATVRLAVTIDAPLAELALNPAPAKAHVADTQSIFVVSVQVPIDVVASFYITQAMANDPALGIIRIQWSNNADAAPVAGTILAAEAEVRVVRTGNLDA